MAETLKIYSFDDGKYEVDRDTETGHILAVRRHGEDWPIQYEGLCFSQMFHAVLNYIDYLERTVNERFPPLY